MEKIRLIKILDQATKSFFKNNEVLYDALEPALQYTNKQDQEFAAFLCSVLAYGRIVQVKRNIHAILDKMGKNPVSSLIAIQDKELKILLKDWKHRFNTEHDMFIFLKTLQRIYAETGSLEKYVQPDKCKNSFELLNSIYKKFYLAIPNKLKPKNSFHFLIPNPELNSASKRMNLYLKWMIRTDYPDLGLWTTFDKSKLIVPLDTHIYKQAKSLGWTKRSAADLTTALEITDKLRELDPKDPTRFDFALCHLSINGTILKA